MIDKENNFVNFLRNTITDEKKIAEQIYSDLYNCYLSYEKVYGEQDNIFKIFFIQILKLLTNIAYKKYELNKNINIPEIYKKKITSWPYVSYKEVHQNKISSKDHNVKQYAERTGKKKYLLNLLQKVTSRNKKKNLYITYDAFNKFNVQLKLLLIQS